MDYTAAGVVRRVVLLFLSVSVAAGASAGIESRSALREFAPLAAARAAGDRVRIERIPVGESVETLNLERFEVWAPDAEIVVEGEGGVRQRLPRPKTQFFRGSVEGDPESTVFLSVEEDSSMQGMILANERRYDVRTRRGRAGLQRDHDGEVFVREIGIEDEEYGSGFICEREAQTITELATSPQLRGEAALPIRAEGALSPTATYTLNIAIDTDFELLQDFGGQASDATDVTTFVANVVGAASTIYRRDLRTDLSLVFTRVHTSASDPFNVVPGLPGTWNGVATTFTGSHALAELGDVWHNARPFAGRFSSAVLMSGKQQTSGVAWLNASCDTERLCSNGNCGSLFNGHYFGPYAFIGLGNPSQTVPNPDATVNGVQYGLGSNYWPVLGFAHELGHNVDGTHTHCVALTAQEKTTWGVSRNFVDQCYSGEAGSGCSSTSGEVPLEKGTVMSYCHLLGASQSRFIFGTIFDPTKKVLDRIGAYIDSMTPASASISAPANANVGVATAASIVGPVAGEIYTWTATNATITGAVNGAFTGTAITFTPTANPATLRVKATGTNGCAATDYVTVNVITCVPASIATHPASVAIWSGTTTQLTVVAGGTSPTYQWYTGASGDTSAPIGGATSATLNVTPASTTNYWVRVTTSCSGVVSVDSNTATVTVTPTPAGGALFNVLTPCRVIDSRQSTSLAGDTNRTIPVSGKCGVPSGARSVAVNVTAVTPSQTGFFALFIGNTAWGGTSTMNYRPNKTRANNAVVPLSPDGKITVRNGSTAATHFIIDVSGYFQ